MTNSTSGTPEVRKTKLAAMKLGELRAHARKLRIDGADELHKPELLAKVKDHHYVSELSSMKLGELRAHARKLGIDGADELHKPELLAKVKDHHYASKGSGGGSQRRRPTGSELSSMKLAELRAHARKLRIDGADELHKPELLAKVKDAHYAQAHGGKHHDGSDLGSSGGGEMKSSAEQDRDRNPSPDPSDVREPELALMKMDGLRPHLPEPGIDGVDGPHQPGLRTEATDAPNAPLGGHLSSWEQERHGGHGGHDGGTTTAPASETTAIYDDHRGRDAADPTVADAITLSQERLSLGTETREADQAKPRNPVVTEHQQMSAPVSREELAVEPEPIVEANRDAAPDALTISEEQHGVLPREERPVVVQEALPVGDVALGTQPRIEQGILGTEVGDEERPNP